MRSSEPRYNRLESAGMGFSLHVHRERQIWGEYGQSRNARLPIVLAANTILAETAARTVQHANHVLL
jgi:hypothetical protein